MKRIHILILIGLFFSACSTQPVPTATQTPEPTPLIQIKELPKNAFNLEILGLDTHGAVIKINKGLPDNIYENLSFSITTRQKSQIIERDLPLQQGNNFLFAEMVDYKYRLGTIDIFINVRGNGFSQKIEYQQISYPKRFPLLV